MNLILKRLWEHQIHTTNFDCSNRSDIEERNGTIQSYKDTVSSMNEELDASNSKMVVMADDMTDLKSDLLREHQKIIQLEKHIKSLSELQEENTSLNEGRNRLCAENRELKCQLKLAEHHLQYRRKKNQAGVTFMVICTQY